MEIQTLQIYNVMQNNRSVFVDLRAFVGSLETRDKYHCGSRTVFRPTLVNTTVAQIFPEWKSKQSSNLWFQGTSSFSRLEIFRNFLLLCPSLPSVASEAQRSDLYFTGICTEKMVLLRQQNQGQQIKFLLLQPKILPQQPNVLLIEPKFCCRNKIFLLSLF